MPDGTKIIRESDTTATVQTPGKRPKVVHKGDLARSAQMPILSLLDFAARKTLPGKTPPKRPDVNLQLARMLSIHKRDSQAKIEGVTKIRKRADITSKRRAAKRDQATSSGNDTVGPSNAPQQHPPQQRTISEKVATKQQTPDDPNEMIDYHSFVGSGVHSIKSFTGSEIDDLLKTPPGGATVPLQQPTSGATAPLQQPETGASSPLQQQETGANSPLHDNNESSPNSGAAGPLQSEDNGAVAPNQSTPISTTNEERESSDTAQLQQHRESSVTAQGGGRNATQYAQ